MKKIITRALPIFLLLATTTLLAQLKDVATVEGITEYQLESNGMKVLLFPDNSSQTITVNITYLVGSRHEGYGEKGMAHLLEHMVFKGTPNHPDIPKELSSHGARPNGTTWYDRTNYFETFNATTENLDWALDLEADRMVNSYISAEDLKSEFSVVRNEFESGENNPGRVLMQKVTDAAFMWHNYGSSTIGNRSDIERVPIENLQAFYHKFYRPDNAVLMVTGKFDQAELLSLIEKKFSKIKNPDTPLPKSYTVEPAQDGEKRVTVSRVGDLQIVSALYHTPSGSSEDYAAMAIVENVLTDAPSGRLYKALIDTQKASSLYSFTPFTKEPGFLYINVDVPSDKDASEVEKILKATLDGVTNNPISEEEMNRAKANIAKQIDQISRNSSYLGRYMSEFIGAGDWRLSYLYRDWVENMTLEKVNTAAKQYLIETNRTIGRFVPTKNPNRVEIPHTEDVTALVKDYKGKEDMGTGEVFDVSFENIKARLEKGKLLDQIEYGMIEKANRGETVNLNFNLRNGNVETLMNKGMLPSMTASMLNKGTTTKDRQQIEDELSRLKSSVWFYGRNGNIYASVSSTKENLMETLTLMADMLKNPTFPKEELDKLKTQQLAGLEQNKTEPRFLASVRLQKINNTYPKGHPNYAMSIEEQEAAVKDVDVEKVKKFYSDFYGMGRATLVSIGTFNSTEVKQLIEKEFKGYNSKMPYTEIKDPYTATKAANEDILTPDKKNATTYGTIGIKMSTDNPDYPAMIMAGEILGGGFLNSRIADRLRQKDGVSYGAGASFGADDHKEDKNSSMFIYSIYNPDNYDKVQLGFKEELDRFIKDGITEEELKNAVNGWIQEQNVSRAKDNELSSLINNNLYWNRTLKFQEDLEKKITSLTVADVNKAIKKYVKPYSEWTVVNAGDFKKE